MSKEITAPIPPESDEARLAGDADPKAIAYAEKLFPCEGPCDSHGICEGCHEANIFWAGYNHGFRKANELAAAEIAGLKKEYAKRKIQVVRSDKAFRELAQERDALRAENARMREALEKIADPRKRHSEPDKYTELGCVMNIANEALTTLSPAEGKGEGK